MSGVRSTRQGCFDGSLLTCCVSARLKSLQQQLEFDYANEITPILEKSADASKNEVFPIIWYASDAQVTGAQHLELAKMVLIAEHPILE